jgi:kynurenine 3-monooxygenase
VLHVGEGPLLKSTRSRYSSPDRGESMARILIVGGGLTGSLLAIYLARRGNEVDVYELRPADRSEFVRTRPALNITLCERGLRALQVVGLRDAVLNLAVPARGRRIHDLDGSVVFQPYGNRGEAIFSISRDALNDALERAGRTEARVRYHFDHKCVGIDLHGGAVRFEVGKAGATTEVEADVIFGADGAYSAVRQQLQKTERFSFSQQYWKAGGYKSVALPARADGSSFFTYDALHIWPRGQRMMMGFPNKDGSMMLSLLLPFSGDDSYETLLDAPSVLAFFRKYFPDVVDLVPSLAQQFLSTPANTLLTVSCEPWSQGRTCLIGDAAHAILPSFGQGANAGFEDCRVLDECIEARGGDWRQVFLEFERRRKPSMDVIAELCRAHFTELSELVADPRFLRRREIERELEELYPDLYRSMYSMVSFTTMSYVEALAVDQAQRVAVDQIAAQVGEGESFDTPVVRARLERALQGTAATDEGAPRRAEAASDEDPTRSGSEWIFSLALSFWNAKVLMSAVELGVFSELSAGPRSTKSLATRIGIHERGAKDFFDALTSLGLLERSQDAYANSWGAQRFLVPSAQSYIGGALDLANHRLYPVWGKLTEALRSGEPQNEASSDTDYNAYYAELARDPERLTRFIQGMTGLSIMAARALARVFPWQNYRTFADIGGAQGVLAAQVALVHEHLHGISFDLPAVAPLFEQYIGSHGLFDRVHFQGGDFFAVPLPHVDVLVMGHVLHNWDLDQKRVLIAKAYDALSPGGVLIVYEAIIDDARIANSFGLLMSLNMLLVTTGGFVFSGAECEDWMRAAGFAKTRVEHLHGPDWMVVAFK